MPLPHWMTSIRTPKSSTVIFVHGVHLIVQQTILLYQQCRESLFILHVSEKTTIRTKCQSTT
jgi:hypothetical protein